MTLPEHTENPPLAAWQLWAHIQRQLGDVRGEVLPPLLEQGFDAFTNALGRPDVAPLVKTLLLELGPLPPWVRPAAIETVDLPALDLLRAGLFHLVARALPAAVRTAGLPPLTLTLGTGMPVEQVQAASITIGELARTALEQRGGGPLETTARLIDGALGHYIRYRMGAETAAHEAMALAAAAARALEQTTPHARLALVRAVLPTWAPWAELMPDAPPVPAVRVADAALTEAVSAVAEALPPPESDAPDEPGGGWLKALISKIFHRDPRSPRG